MKKIYSLMAAFAAVASFSSCEMKDEIWGKDSDGTQGQLKVNLVNNAKTSDDVIIKRSEATDNGNKTGVFAAEEVNVQNYTLEILDDANSSTIVSGTMSGLGANNGSISQTLDEGEYTARAYNYDGSSTNVSTRPYFLGESTISILPGKTTETQITCKLQNVVVAMSLAESFKTSFKDDYSITVDNGDGAAIEFTKDNIDKVYYFKTPANSKSINVSVKATTIATEIVEEAEINRNYTVTKPGTGNDETDKLLAGDAFVINLKEDNSTASYIDFAMSVDFTFAEQTESFEIPTENITYTEKDPTTPDDENTITFEGLPATYTNPHATDETVQVNITAPNTIKNLFVTISSDNTGFYNTIDGFGLAETFDLANPGELESILTSSLESGNGIGLIEPGTVIEGKSEYLFDVTSFMALLKLYGNSNNTFDIKVVDAKGYEKSGTLTVVVNDQTSAE